MKRLQPRLRVLVATDFSDQAKRALPYAANLAGAEGEIILINVQHPRALPAGRVENGEWSHETWKTHRRYLSGCRTRLRRLASQLHCRATPELAIAEKVAAAVLEAARRYRADTICFASYGYAGTTALLLGAVAQEILRSSPCPVLVVRDRG